MKIIRHIAVIVVALVLLLGIPFSRTDYFASLISGNDPDAVTSSTVVLDQPSGNYVVLINRDLRTDEETLDTWIDFFAGKEITFLFEDITCAVAKGDAAGIEMAQSYQSQLPENQMEIRTEDGTLLVSKAENGIFDVIVLSQEMADSLAVSTLYDNPDVVVIETGQ